MQGNTYHITASNDAFVNVGDSYQSGENKYDRLSTHLFPNLQSNKSLALNWDHLQARQKHAGKTGKWLRDSDELKSWKCKPNSFIWLHGIAGCGKTVLSSTVVDYLQNPSEGSNCVASYYFNARESEKRDVSRLLRSLLLQLCPIEGNFSPKVEELYKKCSSQELSNGDLFRGLEELIERGGNTYIIIDALDECDASFRSGEKSEVEKLAQVLLSLAKIKTSNLHLFVTSRDGGLASHIDQALSNIVQSGTEKGICQHIIDLETEEMKIKIDEDIGEFVELELKRWNDCKGRLWLPLSNERKELILNSVGGRANGMFRLAACLLDLLWRKGRWDELEFSLNDLPPELPEVYNRILKDIQSQGQIETAKILLRWLLYSERPLSLEELAEVTMADSQGTLFDPERGTKEESYVSITLSSFVSISKDNLVQFAHQTAKEYLLSETIEEGFFTRTEDCQAFVTKCCLSYMQYCSQFDSKYRPAHDMTRRCPKEYKLLEYAVNNWYIHALGAWKDITPADTLDEPGNSTEETMSQKGVIHWGTLSADGLLARIDDNPESENDPQSLSEWAASVKVWLNLMARMELGLYCDALEATACTGYEKVVGFLLPTEALINSPYGYSYNDAFQLALAGNYRELILLILDGVKRDSEQSDSSWWPEKSNLTAEVHILTYKSHEAIVQLLLEQVIDVNVKDSNGWTALHIAAFQGHETIVRLLLGKGGDIHVKDANGRTPLHTAASQGHDVVTRFLLDQGIEVDEKDKIGWTALDLAVQKVAIDFDPQNTQNHTEYNDRRTALQAVQSNHETMARTIRSLLEGKPNFEGNCDVEILSPVDYNKFSILRGNFSTINIIEDNLRIRTASVVERLVLNGGSVFVMSLIEELLVYGGFSFMRLLSAGTLWLSRWPINSTLYFNEVVIYEGTANFTMSCIRSLVIYGGSVTFSTTAHVKEMVMYGGSVTFLLEAQVKGLMMYGGTVSFATTAQVEGMAMYGGSVTFLKETQVKGLVIYGGTANIATTAQIKEVAIYDGTANFVITAQIERVVIYGGLFNFLTMADIKQMVMYGGSANFIYQICREIMLLLREEFEIERENNYGNNMVQIGEVMMYDGSLRIYTKGRIGPVTKYGGAIITDSIIALKSAARSGNEPIARLLIEKGADPNENVLDGSGCTALHEAAFQGHEAVVQLLLEKNADICVKNYNGQTAFQIAASQGHTAIVRLLEEQELRVDMKDDVGMKRQTMLQKVVERVLFFFSR